MTVAAGSCGAGETDGRLIIAPTQGDVCAAPAKEKSPQRATRTPSVGYADSSLKEGAFEGSGRSNI